MGTLLSWLQAFDLERYDAVFAEHEVDLDALRLLSEQHLERLGALSRCAPARRRPPAAPRR